MAGSCCFLAVVEAKLPRIPENPQPQSHRQKPLALPRETQAVTASWGALVGCEAPDSPLHPYLHCSPRLWCAPGGRGGGLTTPMSATPEPTLMMVGMMLNFPACGRDKVE